MDELQQITEEHGHDLTMAQPALPPIRLPRPQRYGLWTALDATLKTQKGEVKRLCRCDCGTERYVLERALKSGTSQSCGCQRRKNAAEAIAYELTGETFGELTVLGRADTKKSDGVRWRCQCSCGNFCEAAATLLVTGKRTNCGGLEHHKNYAFSDITGKKFHRLTALYPLKDRGAKGSVIWHCRCDCGNEIDIAYNTLVYTSVKSCGCQKIEHNQKLGSFLTHVGGTSIDMLKSDKVPSNNTTGVKGVYFIRGRYVAKIVFQKKQYFLGSFDNFHDAAMTRKEAEEEIQKVVLDYYNRWQLRAREDPQWAEVNPIHFQVERDNAKQLRIICLPELK